MNDIEATIKGVVDRLSARGLTEASVDPGDSRRLTISLTGAGRDLVVRASAVAEAITEETLAPLTPAERTMLLKLIDKIR